MDKKRILLIEDDQFIIELYNRVLTQAGYEVDCAKDGEEGLAKARAYKHDLILLDIILPKISGVNVLKDLKNDPKTSGIPVMVLSNIGQDEIIKDCLSLGAVGYLIKSQHLPQEVVARVNDFLVSGNNIGQ